MKNVTASKQKYMLHSTKTGMSPKVCSTQCSFNKKHLPTHPICTIHGIFSYIFHKRKPHVNKYSIHGACGHDWTLSNQRDTPLFSEPHLAVQGSVDSSPGHSQLPRLSESCCPPGHQKRPKNWHLLRFQAKGSGTGKKNTSRFGVWVMLDAQAPVLGLFPGKG